MLTEDFPKDRVERSGTNVVLAWHTNPVGFQLQSTTDVVPTDGSPVGEQGVVGSNEFTFAVTNPASGPSRYDWLVRRCGN